MEHENKIEDCKKNDKVRKFAIGDFDEVMKIFDETDFGCVGENDIYKPGRQEQMLMMREVLRGVYADEKILVYDRLGQVLGYVTIQEQNNDWHIGEFVVDPAYRGQGIGSYFMEVIQKLAIRCNKNILLESFDKNNRFFLKHGFEKVSEDDLIANYRWEYQRQLKQEFNDDEPEL